MPALPDGRSQTQWENAYAASLISPSDGGGYVPPPAPAGTGTTPRAHRARRRTPTTPAPSAPAALPSASLGESPAYLAFLRAADLEGEQSRTASQDRIDVLRRGLDRDVPDIQKAGEYTREGISGNFEARGLYRSGAHEQGLARQREGEGRQIANLQALVADQVGLIEKDLARRLAEIEARKANAALDGAGEIYR